jgi:hypothetical protein
MNNHFAELGDVWKHLPLAEILRINPPRQYWETHARSASYALTESPSRLHGALRFSRALLAIQTSVAALTFKGSGHRRVSIPALPGSLCRLSVRAQPTSSAMSTPRAPRL